MIADTPEFHRLEEDRARKAHWRRWGPYLSDRQWGTVREDYSPGGTAWESISHDDSRSRAYRWGEDGLLGISDNQQRLCFGLALWNGEDPILKERLFGLTGNQGNHGEDVKEAYFHLDSTPTHSYMKALYTYPQRAFPYDQLVRENAVRSRQDPEFELADTGAFDENRTFDVFTEYAKASAEEVLICLTVVNRGPDRRTLHVLPTLWFRNTWSWGKEVKPRLREIRPGVVEAQHPTLGTRWWSCENAPPILFTENETNFQKMYGVSNTAPFVKDAFHEFVIGGHTQAVNEIRVGTKAAAHYILDLMPGETRCLRLRLSDTLPGADAFGSDFNRSLTSRQSEADGYYAALQPAGLSDDLRNIQRQAFAGLLWSKQYYRYSVEEWLTGDPGQPPPPDGHRHGRNSAWRHFHAEDIHLHAGQVGVPLVRGLGLGLPLLAAGPWSIAPFAKTSARADDSANGTCTRTASFPPTSGLSTTSIRPFTRGPAGASTRSIAKFTAEATLCFWSGGLPKTPAQFYLVGEPGG
jgi:hypothetical protein